jgi:3-oxoacyl-[acyl-carrier-protein] synthase III
MEIKQINLIKDKAKRQMELTKWIAVMEFFLFGDGVASFILTKDEGKLAVNKIVEATNLQGTDYLAGYARLTAASEPFKFGFISHLDKEIPNLGVKYVARCLQRLLGKNTDNMKTVKKWAIHTGSEKILSVIAEHYGIRRERFTESYGVLGDYGNLAGASLPFILERILSQNRFSEGDVILALGYGWGFSASATMLEYKE